MSANPFVMQGTTPLWYQLQLVIGMCFALADSYDCVVPIDAVTLRVCPFPYPCHDDAVSLW